jgi:hypothetical protein
MKHLLITMGLLLFAFGSFSQVGHGKVKDGDQYKIEDSLVSKTEYDKKLKGLKKIEGTYVCKKTTYGGHNWYKAKDKSGKVYVVSNLMEGDYWYCSIFKAIELKTQ